MSEFSQGSIRKAFLFEQLCDDFNFYVIEHCHYQYKLKFIF